jgi:hypothetical protein
MLTQEKEYQERPGYFVDALSDLLNYDILTGLDYPFRLRFLYGSVESNIY